MPRFSILIFSILCVMMATILATDIMHFDTCIRLHQFPFHHHADMNLQCLPSSYTSPSHHKVSFSSDKQNGKRWNKMMLIWQLPGPAHSSKCYNTIILTTLQAKYASFVNKMARYVNLLQNFYVFQFLFQSQQYSYFTKVLYIVSIGVECNCNKTCNYYVIVNVNIILSGIICCCIIFFII